MISVSFTGHRPDKIGGYDNEKPQRTLLVNNWLEEVTRRIIEKFGDVNFISGGAQGVDTMAAEIILQHKEKYKDKNIHLTMAIPCPQFGEDWPEEAKNRLQYIIKQSDKSLFVRDNYTGPIVLDLRNKWMVDNSSIIVAVWDGSLGGTRNCFKYAQEMQKKIWRLNLYTGETMKYS